MCTSVSASAPPPSVRRSLEHERAFRRWSLPAAAECSDGEGGPTSFRVYSPDELRAAPLRPSNQPSSRRGRVDPLGDGAAPQRTLLQWLGIGVAIGTLGLTAAALLVALTDDTRGRQARSAVMSVVAPAPAAPALAVETSMTPAAEAPPEVDFEIPDDPQPAPVAKKPRAASAEPRLAVRQAPF